MIFTRIKRGATRANLLVRYKLSSVRRPIALRIARTARTLSLTTLAAYTSLSGPMAHAAAPVLAAPEEPPSIVQVALAPAANQHFSTADPLVVESPSLEVSSPQITKSRATLQDEENAREAEIARQQAAEKARQDAINRQRRVQLAVAHTASTESWGDLNGMIDRYSAQNGVDGGLMRRIIMCESGGNPQAINGHYYVGNDTPKGVGQFLSSTFYANFRRAGISGTPDVWNPEQQIAVMAWMLAHGQAHQWACY